MIVCKSSQEIERIREAGRIVARALSIVKKNLKPGVTTQLLDKLVEEYIRGTRAEPAFKGYRGFPASICASINEGVVHGIPSDNKLKESDIISVDVGVAKDGYFADAAITVPVGEITAEVGRLLSVTAKALQAGIAQAQVGKRLGDISYAIQKVPEEAGFSVVRDFVGHGIGQKMHEEPQVPNFGLPGQGPKLEEGLVLALEPMVNLGGPDVKVLEDGWTTVTSDGSLSAHFEHTVAITSNGPVILTNDQPEHGS